MRKQGDMGGPREPTLTSAAQEIANSQMISSFIPDDLTTCDGSQLYENIF